MGIGILVAASLTLAGSKSENGPTYAASTRSWQVLCFTKVLKCYPKVLKVGDWNYVPRGTVHRNENKTDKPARTIELNVLDKDAPALQPVAETQ